jgi:flagellar motor protein MotB
MMARKKTPAEAKAGASEWMGTYAGLLMLLFMFFVLLYSLSGPDAERFRALAGSLAERGDGLYASGLEHQQEHVFTGADDIELLNADAQLMQMGGR